MNRPRRSPEEKCQLAGWVLFMICAVLFIAAAWRSGDGLTLAGSIVFLVACFFFFGPLVRRGGPPGRN